MPSGSCAIHCLLELHDDLLTNCAAQSAHAATLLQLSQSCKAFERIVLRDPSSAELVWRPALTHARLLAQGTTADGLSQHRPSAALYRALATVDLRWEQADLEVVVPQPVLPAASARAARRIRASLTGRTGGALCRLYGELLLYGGTLNGNHGPVRLPAPTPTPTPTSTPPSSRLHSWRVVSWCRGAAAYPAA